MNPDTRYSFICICSGLNPLLKSNFSVLPWLQSGAPPPPCHGRKPGKRSGRLRLPEQNPGKSKKKTQVGIPSLVFFIDKTQVGVPSAVIFIEKLGYIFRIVTCKKRPTVVKD